MKSFKILLVGLCLVSASAFAAGGEVSSNSGSSGVKRVGVGFSSLTNFTGAASSAAVLLKLNDKNAIQLLLSVPSASPFQFSVGGQYKATVAQHQNAGFHLGAGLSIGSLAVGGRNVFAVAINPLAGFHLPLIAGDRVELHLDGGPNLTLLDGTADFTIGAHSALLGATLVYLF
jgi:hypothetical protein